MPFFTIVSLPMTVRTHCNAGYIDSGSFCERRLRETVSPALLPVQKDVTHNEAFVNGYAGSV